MATCASAPLLGDGDFDELALLVAVHVLDEDAQRVPAREGLVGHDLERLAGEGEGAAFVVDELAVGITVEVEPLLEDGEGIALVAG